MAQLTRFRRWVSRRFRPRRMARFVERMGIREDTSVLDVGGTDAIWSLLPLRPRLVILNRHPRRRALGHTVVGDGRYLPFPDGAVDVVFSNSVIEHVGGRDAQQRFADECRRVGRGYYVQTPSRAFPFEPHAMGFFLHWLPRKWQISAVRWCSLWGLMTRPSREGAEAMVDGLHLLTESDLRRLFPDAEIWVERVLGMAKSLVAVRYADRGLDERP